MGLVSLSVPHVGGSEERYVREAFASSWPTRRPYCFLLASAAFGASRDDVPRALAALDVEARPLRKPRKVGTCDRTP